MPKGQKAKPVAWLNLNDAARGKVENPVNWAYSLLVIWVRSCSRKERVFFLFFYVENKALGNLKGQLGGEALQPNMRSDLQFVRFAQTWLMLLCENGLFTCELSWSDNERRETESSGGEMKSPLAQTDRRRDQRCASANIFFIHPSFCSLLTSSAFSLQETL